MGFNEFDNGDALSSSRILRQVKCLENFAASLITSSGSPRGGGVRAIRSGFIGVVWWFQKKIKAFNYV